AEQPRIVDHPVDRMPAGVLKDHRELRDLAWRSDDIPPVTALPRPMDRTTRPNVMPRLRSTLMPGSSNAEVTGNVVTGDSAVSVMVRSTPVSQAGVNEARSPTPRRKSLPSLLPMATSQKGVDRP